MSLFGNEYVCIQTGKPPLRFQLYSDRTEDYSQFTIAFECNYTQMDSVCMVYV